MNKFKQEQLISMPQAKNYWAIHFGINNKYANFGYENGLIAVGWNEIGKNLSSFSDLDKEEFLKKLNPILEKAYKDHPLRSRSQIAGQLFRFCNLIKNGDIILMPKTDEGKIYLGIIDSDYFYETKKDECEFKQRRKVKWLKMMDLGNISQKLKFSIGGIMTIFSVSDHGDEIESLISEKIGKELIGDLEEFGMESHLEDFIVENWTKLDLGKKYDIYSEDEGISGKQYVTPIGRIDILAKSKDKKEWLIIELKKGRTPDDVVGQTLRYMGWIAENEAKNGEKVQGLIISGAKDEKLFYALKTLNNVSFMTYSVSFKLKKEKIK